MVDNAAQGVCPDKAVPDVGVAVLAGTPLVPAVIDMKKGNLIFSNQLIKSVNYPVKIIYDIVSLSKMAASSSKLRPISEPFPAMVSSAM